METFNKTSNFIKYIKFNNKNISHKLIEKVSIRWVSINTILSCIECNGTDIEPPIRMRSVFLKSIILAKNQLIFISKN